MRHKQQKILEQNIQHLESYIKAYNLRNITPETMILTITEADPDQANFKNSKWLIKNLLNNSFLWEDIEAGKSSKAYDTLSRFLNIRKQWPESNLRDIQSYKGLSGIAEKIRPFEITKSMGEIKREEKAKIYEETIVLYDKNDYLVVIPKTQEASCFWGRGTEWCTASTQSTNYFNSYNTSGPLLICITPNNRKYQFHKDSSPMNENDTPIKNIIDPVLIKLALFTQHLSNINQSSLKTLLSNQEFLFQYVKDNPIDKKYIQKKFLNEEMYSYLIKNNDIPFDEIPDKIKTKELCEIAVRKNGIVLPYVPKRFITKELCILALKQNGLAIDYVPDQYRKKDLLTLAVQQNAYALKKIKKSEVNDLDSDDEYIKLCNIAVQRKGLALEFVPEEYKTYELCKLAVQQDAQSFEFVPEKHKTYELSKLAVQTNGVALYHINDKNRTEEICKIALNNYGLSLRFLSQKDRTLELCLIALTQNKNAIKYVPEEYKMYIEVQDILNITKQDKQVSPQWIHNRLHESYSNILNQYLNNSELKISSKHSLELS